MKPTSEKLLFILFYLILTVSINSQSNLKSFYSGAIEIFGQKINCNIRFDVKGDSIKSTIDIPQQRAFKIPINNIVLKYPKISFSILAGERKGIFDGIINGDSISGTFTQSGLKGKFHLEATEELAKDAAQANSENKEERPYTSEEVSFNNEEIKLAGTLTIPEGEPPFPAVIMITGSGAQNRDEDIFGFKLFKVIADYLTRNGITVLRYDDRGVGGSTGNILESTTEDFAEDVLAAVNYLKSDRRINRMQIGLIGHSEGGNVAPLVASESEDIAFIVLMAGTGLPGKELLTMQRQLISEAQGASGKVIELQERISNLILDSILEGNDFESIKPKVLKLGKEVLKYLPPEQTEGIEDTLKYLTTIYQSQFIIFNNNWSKFFLVYDPAETLQYVECPVLMLFGGKDLQVPAIPNKEKMEEALTLGGNRNYTTIIFPDANHLFQKAETGNPANYSGLEKKFIDGFLDSIVEWIDKTIHYKTK